MWEDVDSILEMRGTKPETATFELAEDTVLDGLLTSPTEAPSKPHVRAKRHSSICTTKVEDSRAIIKERKNLEALRRASLSDEETRQMSAQE